MVTGTPRGKHRVEVTSEQWLTFATHMQQFGNITAAARAAGMSRSTAARALRDTDRFPDYRRALRLAKELSPQEAKAYRDLKPEAIDAVRDFAYFRERYFGRVATPWAVYTANLVAELLATPDKEFVVVNQPPGVGKTTFWTLDLPAWLICRDRAVRIQLGSSAQSTAQDFVQQLRRELEREHIIEADDDSKQKGLSLDATGLLVDDFGGFKPPRGEPWTAEQFVVKQVGDRAKQNKEATVKALGRDTKFLGKRCNLIVWDDLVDERNTKTAEAREDLERWWAQFAETRLEPGGLCVLQGQRLHADDLYQHAVKIEVTEYADDGWGEPTGVRKQYRHVKFKAHYDELCRGDHRPQTAIPYNPGDPAAGGCLLDPKRLTYRDVMAVKDKDPRLFAVSYQQEDIDPAQVLVNPIWINGGTDPATGEEFPGCWDRTASMGVIPPGLSKPFLSVVTADPSPTKFWCLAEGQRVLTSDGEVPIEHVTIAHRVLTRAGWKQVERAEQTGVRHVLDVTLSNGRVLKITPEHQVLTNNGWLPAGHLRVGSTLAGANTGTRPAVPLPPVDAQVLAGVGMVAGAVGGVDLPLDVGGAGHVLPMGLHRQMGRVAARRVLAEMADLHPGRYCGSTVDKHAVGEAVCQTLPQRRAYASVPGRVDVSGPQPAAAFAGGDPIQEEVQVDGQFAASGGGTVSAGHAALGLVTDDHRAAFADLHVVSVTDGAYVPVFDIGVADQPEFVAEGVIVHNSIQWWLFHPGTEQRFLIDHARKAMGANDFLDYIIATQSYDGLLDEWHTRSVEQGAPITHIIVERNAAQRFLLQYDYVHTWARKKHVTFIPHDTYANKADPQYGVQALLPQQYRYGKVRLPSGDQLSRGRSMALVNEVTRYPESSTTDCVMAHWFAEVNYPKLKNRLLAPKEPPVMQHKIMSASDVGGMYAGL